MADKKPNPFVKKAAAKIAAKKKGAAGKESADTEKGSDGKKLPPWLMKNDQGKVVAKKKGSK